MAGVCRLFGMSIGSVIESSDHAEREEIELCRFIIRELRMDIKMRNEVIDELQKMVRNLQTIITKQKETLCFHGLEEYGN